MEFVENLHLLQSAVIVKNSKRNRWDFRRCFWIALLLVLPYPRSTVYSRTYRTNDHFIGSLVSFPLVGCIGVIFKDPPVVQQCVVFRIFLHFPTLVWLAVIRLMLPLLLPCVFSANDGSYLLA